ncbi:MAG: alginate lyase family protein [Steroidobacteraceae bacterium]
MRGGNSYRAGGALSTLARYFHTVRHLRPIQVAGRLRLHWHHPVADTRAAPGTRLRGSAYLPPIERAPSLLQPQVFRFHNEERRCSSPADWSPAGAAELWVYHLHYFDDLNARDANARLEWHLELLERWVAENPPGAGAAWDPYPTSRRIANWVKWAARGHELPARCQASLAVQTRWLEERLEYHLLGNHLLANAKALVHAGLHFDGPEAERWFSRGMDILERELREQVLADGGHFERSTMYHAAALEDLLDLMNLLRSQGCAPPVSWLGAIAAMRRWLKVMTHPDGELAFFNDAAFEEAPTSAQLEAFAGRLGLAPVADPSEPLIVLEASGYVRAIAGSAYLICDCAAVGPDHLPAHAHADTLSFELSLCGRRLFVNSGTSLYGTGPERQRQRGTAAHNTVVADECDSSEVWAGFRVARRARARLHGAHELAPGVLIDASHDGYRRLPRGGEHRRRWRLEPQSLHIEDRLDGALERAEARFHLHPDVAARVAGEREVALALADGSTARLSAANAGALQVVPATWHPRFGVEVANQCVTARFAGGVLSTRIAWAAPA